MKNTDTLILEGLYSEGIESSKVKEHLDLIKRQYSNRRIILTNDEGVDLTREIQTQGRGPKPNGLWYALGSEWLHWLSTEMPDWLDDYSHAFYLDLDYSKILRINDDKKFEQFEETYSDHSNAYGNVDWSFVAMKYKGIEIIPYRMEYRTESFWYYPWDIASGCIWDLSAIKKTVKIF